MKPTPLEEAPPTREPPLRGASALQLASFVRTTDSLPELWMDDASKLRAIKVLHTLVWAVFAGSILVIPVMAFLGKQAIAWGLIGFVFLEVLVVATNRMRCPLTDVAGRYTVERQDNFDIYLPLWLARYNKHIFGGLYVVGIVYATWRSLT